MRPMISPIASVSLSLSSLPMSNRSFRRTASFTASVVSSAPSLAGPPEGAFYGFGNFIVL